MSIIIALAIGAVCGISIGLFLRDALDGALPSPNEQLQHAEAELTLMRRRCEDLQEEITILVTTLNATRDREQMLAEMAREMNQ